MVVEGMENKKKNLFPSQSEQREHTELYSILTYEERVIADMAFQDLE